MTHRNDEQNACPQLLKRLHTFNDHSAQQRTSHSSFRRRWSAIIIIIIIIVIALRLQRRLFCIASGIDRPPPIFSLPPTTGLGTSDEHHIESIVRTLPELTDRQVRLTFTEDPKSVFFAACDRNVVGTRRFTIAPCTLRASPRRSDGNRRN
jgi:hypothetical protein